MVTVFNEVYPRSPRPLTSKTLDNFPFYFDSRRGFFEKSWEAGAFGEGSVTMLMAPRIFGKTSFINMLRKFMAEKKDKRTIYSCSCIDSKQLEDVRVAVHEMLKDGENRVLILDEMNYAIERRSLWEKIVELAKGISQMKGRGQTIVLTTSEMSSGATKEAFEVLHPVPLRLPALNEDETKLVALGVLKEVTGKGNIPSEVLELIWKVSGGIPPYIRISLLRAVESLGKGKFDVHLPTACMFDIFDNLDAVESCIQTLTNCTIETARMSDKDIALMADQFCLSCPVKCREPSVIQPVVETSLARRYGLVFTSNSIASPIAFYYNDYLGRKRFEDFSSDIVNKEDVIRAYVDAYGNKEFTNDILVLLEIAIAKPSLFDEKLNANRIVEFLRSKTETVFIEGLPRVGALTKWIADFNSVCRTTVHGDKGIDLEIHNLKLSAEVPAINAYVQCKNWKTKINLKEVGIFHKFEMVLRNAKQVHAAILISTSEIDDPLIEEATALTKENRSVFSCWGGPQLTTIVSALCGKRKEVQSAIQKLSIIEGPTKVKGGALEYLTLKTFSVLAEKVVQC